MNSIKRNSGPLAFFCAIAVVLGLFAIGRADRFDSRNYLRTSGSTGTASFENLSPNAAVEDISWAFGYNGSTWDRIRLAQAKGLTQATITATSGSDTSLTFSADPSTAANGGLKAGQQMLLTTGAALTGSIDVVYVGASYVSGTTVPISTGPNQSVTAGRTRAAFDTFAQAGPGTTGFLPSGLSIGLGAIFNPADGKYYAGGTSGTADGNAGANLPLAADALWNGATWDRAKSGSAANAAAKSGVGSNVAVQPGNWSVVSTPSSATQATASQAAGGAGVRHVCTGIYATLAAGSTAQAAAVILNLRDGATGAGTILWSKQVILPANGLWEIDIGSLSIPGSAATAMTLEFAAAGATGTFESVTITGYDTQ